VHHHRLWQVEFLKLPQEEHPLLRLLGGGADVQLPLEVLGDDGAQEAVGLHSVNGGVTQGERGWWGCVLSEVHNHLHCLQSVTLQVVLAAPGHQMVRLPPVGGLIPIRDDSNEGGVVCKLQELDGLVTGGAAVGVQREEQRGKNTALGGTGADGPRGKDVFPNLTCCFLSDRKSMIHLHVDLGMCS